MYWLNSKSCLVSLKKESIESAKAAIQAATTQAVTTITELMTNSQNDAVRFNAAKEILAMTGVSHASYEGACTVAKVKKERLERASF